MRHMLTRRDVLRSASALALGSLLPQGLWSAVQGRTVRSDRTLVLLEFEGGNDGLNTIIPTAQQTLYDARRPSLKLAKKGISQFTDYVNQCIPLAGSDSFSTGATASLTGDASGLAIHGAMNPLRAAWQAGDMAVVQGVGYANPNRSHFRGIDIWNNGATDNQPLLSSGWLGRMFSDEGLDTTSKTNAVLFRRANNSPVANSTSKAIAMGSPEDFITSSAYLIGENLDDGNPWNDVPALVTAAPAPTGNDALDRILTARWQVVEARSKVIDAMAATATGQPLAAQLAQFTTDPQIDLLLQARHVFRCIAGGLDCAVYKISIGGFDTHTAQKTKHADLLGAVAKAIKALRTALIAAGKWDSTLIMSYSEFGRRIEENGSAGTDHGTAAPHFFFGGGINGGVYGSYPTLAVTHPWDDMEWTTDFRHLYATCGTWLGVASAADGTGVDPFNAGLSFSGVGGLLA